jgi:hydroxyacylglutathione hydrolase
MLQIYPVRAFKDNYIWVIHNQHYAAVVDPGDALPVLRYLQDLDLRLIAILNTHHHPDHVGGNGALLKHFSVPVYGPANESISTLTHHLQEGGIVQLPELSLDFSVLDTPGHTAGHIVYYATKSEKNLLFCGDTLFACGCGRIFEGTAQQMYTSLQKLAKLPDETLIYCAHEYTLGNIRFARTVDPENMDLSEREAAVEEQRRRDVPTLPSTISIEKTTNPFLRCHHPDIIDNVNVHAGRSLSDPVSVFTELRKWKNVA